MTSHRRLASNRQDRLGPRPPGCPRSPRSPRFPRPAAARVQRCYRRRALLASCISPNPFPLSFLAGDFFESISLRVPSLLPGFLTHASRVTNMDSEDGELFVKVRVRGQRCVNKGKARAATIERTDTCWNIATCHICAYARESIGQRFATAKAECPTTWCITQRVLRCHQWPHIADRRRTPGYIRSLFVKWSRLRTIFWRFELHSTSTQVGQTGPNSTSSILPTIPFRGHGNTGRSHEDTIGESAR